jgi:hypothetical protein
MTTRTLCVLIFMFCGTAGLQAQQPRLIYDQLFKPEGARYHNVPIGLCEDYPEETTTMEIIRADMELLKRSGIRVLRISFGWDGIEASPGNYNWLFWDDYVKTAVEEYGVTLIPYVCYTPSWNSTGDTTNFWNHTPKDYDAFGRFMYALVDRYKPWIKTWELWNEPDIDAYWSGTAGDLAKLTKIGARAVRNADPEAKVVLAGLAHRTEFTRELFSDHGISPFVDVVNCHSYYETWSGEPLETITEYVATLAEIIQKYGNGQDLWMAEVGYSTFRKPDGFVSDSYHGTYDYEHTPRYQAVALWRTLTLLLATEKVSAIAWYEIKDLPPQENVIGDVNNRNLGVADVQHRPKPAEQALKFFNSFFRGRYRSLDAETSVRREAASESVVHTFQWEDGSAAVVGWLKTHIKGKRIDGPRGTVQDTRQETLEVVLPFSGSADISLYDELGNRKPFPDARTQGGKLTVPSLVLRGGEITILRVAHK